MCGPIVLALPGAQDNRIRLLVSRLLYNLGRTITYAFMGLIMGIIGETISLTGYQQPVSIALGVLILVAVLLPSSFMQRFYPADSYARFTAALKRWWGKLFNKNTYSSLLVIGLLNGFLPCGLVYMALAGSLAVGGVVPGISYMVLFGLGTIPVMLAMSFVGNFIGVRTRRYINRLLPVGAALIAVLFILRGLGLGIPFLSPPDDMTKPVMMHSEMKEEKPACCHPE
jgi:sulfite exporter TauE/SafE